MVADVEQAYEFNGSEKSKNKRKVVVAGNRRS